MLLTKKVFKHAKRFNIPLGPLLPDPFIPSHLLFRKGVRQITEKEEMLIKSLTQKKKKLG